MEGNQIVALVVAAAILFFFVRRTMQMKGIQQFTAAQLSEQLEARAPIVVLDVRTQAERNQSSIKNSLHIPVSDLGRRAEELKKYMDKQIVCYCASGSRSVTAALALKKKGFNTGNLKGGIGDWNFYHRNR